LSGRIRTILIIVGALAVSAISTRLLPSGPPHVEVAAETLFYIGGFPFTNSILMMLIVDVILIVLALAATRNMQLVPQGVQNVMELVIESLYNLFRNFSPQFIGRAFPLVASIFLFVLISNWSGLVPGGSSIGVCHAAEEKESARLAVVESGPLAGAIRFFAPAAAEENPYTTCPAGTALIPLVRPPSTDLNFTLGLGLLSFVFFEFWAFRTLGLGYLKKFFNLNGVNSFVGLIELFSELLKPLALALRLFGNIFAGEVLIAVLTFLVPLALPMPIYGFEIFVGFIQALIFALLTMAFLKVATTSHEEEHKTEGAAHGAAH
jgi:F-type H+-transporting ATPase subunit a